MANQIHNQNDALTRAGGNTVVAELCSIATLAMALGEPNSEVVSDSAKAACSGADLSSPLAARGVESDLALYEQKVKARLSPACAAWLERGRFGSCNPRDAPD